VLQLPQNLQHPPAMETKPIVEHKSLYELLTVNPYDFPETGFECTITIAEIPAEHKWWFPSCTKCNKATIPHTTGYHCESCNWDGYKFKYKLKFLASDETDIAEMFCFDTVARHIVGKSCEIVLRSVTEQSPIPPDLAQIISLKFTFRVTIDNQSLFQQTSCPNVFRINSIVAAHGRQRSLPMQIGISDQQGPSTPQNKSKPMLLEDSPSTTLEKLSTTTPTTVVRKLLYSETDNTPKAANKSNINSPEKDDGDKETAQLDTIPTNKGKGPADTIESPPKRFKQGTIRIGKEMDIKSSEN